MGRGRGLRCGTRPVGALGLPAAGGASRGGFPRGCAGHAPPSPVFPILPLLPPPPLPPLLPEDLAWAGTRLGCACLGSQFSENSGSRCTTLKSLVIVPIF